MARILVVDEEPLIGEVIADSLEIGGHSVVSVDSVDAALAAVSAPFDILFLHRRLPDAACDEIVYRARHYTEPYVVLLSSEHSDAAEQNKVRLGAAEILYKPLDPLTIRAVVGRYEADDKAPLEIPEKPRILVVDDDELVLMSVVETLELRERFEVEGTRSPHEALARLRSQPYELLITDLLMEEMPGIDLIRAARNTRPSLNVIVMTGYARKETAVAALKEGAYDFLEKPLTPKLVVSTVERAWKTTRYEFENRKLLHQLRLMNRELLAAKEAAEAASEAKSRFLANVSHELRTPLHGVLGPLSLVRSDNNLDPEQSRFLSLAERSGQTLLDLVNDLLDMTQEGTLALVAQDIPLAKFLQEIVDTHQARAEEVGVALTLDLDPDLPTKIYLDPGRLHQVLRHLLGNALKFTTRGHVRLYVESGLNAEGAQEVRIHVEDTGIGIAADAQEKIFHLFTQVDESIRRMHGGAGIGLNLSRRLVKHLGGSLEVESTPGVGSTFSVVLPLDAMAADAESSTSAG